MDTRKKERGKEKSTGKKQGQRKRLKDVYVVQ